MPKKYKWILAILESYFREFLTIISQNFILTTVFSIYIFFFFFKILFFNDIFLLFSFLSLSPKTHHHSMSWVSNSIAIGTNLS